MLKLRYITYILAGCLFACSCTDEVLELKEDGQGQVRYRFAATIEGEIESGDEQTRMGFVDDSYNGLKLHWETGDKIVLKPDDSSDEYVFTAAEYLWHTDGTYEKRTDEMTASDTDRSVYFFEYDGDPIANADHFTGTATCRNLNKEMATLQLKNDDPSHLKYCEELTAYLDDVDLTLDAGAWMPDNLQLKVPFYHSGQGAYLKIITGGYKYPIWPRSTVSVYVLDESVSHYDDTFEPLSTVYLGSKDDTPSTSALTADYSCKSYYLNSSGSLTGTYYTYHTTYELDYPTDESTPFLDVPTYMTSSGNKLSVDENRVEEDFDDISRHYTADGVRGVFYVPIRRKDVPQGPYMYIATVVQDFWSGDLYVWEKKVPVGLTLENGKLYTLDYTDRTPDYALAVNKNLCYVRNRFLEQDVEGIKGKAPRFTLLGEKVEQSDLGKTVKTSPNKVTGLHGFDWKDVLKMRRNHGAFYVSSSPMCSIGPQKTWYWNWSTNPDGTGWTNTNYPKFSTTSLVDGPYTDCSVDSTKTYMKKITKGYIPWEGMFSIGKVVEEKNMFSGSNNCTEYVLLDEYDPVINSRKTSSLWRAPYGRELQMFCSVASDSQKNHLYAYVDREAGYLLMESTKTGHRICLPFLPEYYESGMTRGTYLDGSDTKKGKWYLRGVYGSEHFIQGRSVRSFGANNSAFMQGVGLCMLEKGKMGFEQKFGIAACVLPVFRSNPSSFYSSDLKLWD